MFAEKNVAEKKMLCRLNFMPVKSHHKPNLLRLSLSFDSKLHRQFSIFYYLILFFSISHSFSSICSYFFHAFRKRGRVGENEREREREKKRDSERAREREREIDRKRNIFRSHRHYILRSHPQSRIHCNPSVHNHNNIFV